MRALILSLLVAAAFCRAAEAEAVPVQSGEHAGFVRLVLTFAGPVDWRVTRHGDGYELAVDRTGLRYDLSGVYARIGRGRLSAIWADPETGALRLGVGCACHLIPFEYRTGVLVLDLRDGPPPAGSSFENDAAGVRMAALTAPPPKRPRARPGRAGGPATPAPSAPAARPAGYDWLALRLNRPGPDPLTRAPAAPVQPARAPLRDVGEATATVDLGNLRRTLMYDMARGAARGAVDLALPVAPAAPPGVAGDPKQVSVREADRLTAMIGLREPEDVPALATDGQVCTGDAALDVTAWGDPRPVAQALGPLTGALYGEFDRVDTAAAGRAVRYLLSLGFGAEAAGMILSLGLEGDDAARWRSMARIVDGGTDPDGPLAAMAACDTAAAFWAALSHPALARDQPVNTGAVLRAFSALPPHLRRHLGPPLADRLLAHGDTAAVRAVLQAMERAPESAGPGAALIGADLAVATGTAPDSASLDDLRRATGPAGVAATVTLMRATLLKGEPVEPALIAEAEARLMEYNGTPEAALLRQALAEAQASQGNFPRAFALAATADAVPVWAILARTGGVAALLDHAILADGTAPPDLPDALRRGLARRLLDLGFGRPALAWTGTLDTWPEALPASLAPEDRLLAAEAALVDRDGSTALRRMAGLAGAAADVLRLRAMAMRADGEALRLATAIGDDTAEALARTAGDWPRVAAEGPDLWRVAARHALPTEATEAPPLARSRTLLDDSAATRDGLAALLDATALTAPDTPPAPTR